MSWVSWYQKKNPKKLVHTSRKWQIWALDSLLCIGRNYTTWIFQGCLGFSEKFHCLLNFAFLFMHMHNKDNLFSIKLNAILFRHFYPSYKFINWNNLLKHMIQFLVWITESEGLLMHLSRKCLLKGHYVPDATGSKIDVASTRVWREV